LRLNDPELVRREYGDGTALAERRKVFTTFVQGPNAADIAFEAVAERRPARLLEAGCGEGEFAERVVRELGAEVVALDLSAHMVESARARGIDARVGDVQELAFAEGEFDVVVANWMLYHVPDLDRGIAELARVLRPGGRLVAATFGEDNLRELWLLLGETDAPAHPFSRDNGEEALNRHFARVERRDAQAEVIFPNAESLRRYVAASIRRRHLVDRVPDLDTPFRARSSQAVFVAQKSS
jgi:ubiquinone/menaquinone biosynthesis C-methylase UbiE